MTPHLSLADGSSFLVDADVGTAHVHLKWQRPAVTIVSGVESIFFDIAHTVGGRVAIQSSIHFEYQTSNTSRLTMSFRLNDSIGSLGSSSLVDIGLTAESMFQGNIKSQVVSVFLSERGLSFHDCASSSPYQRIVVDSAALQTTVLPVSLWPGSDTLLRYKARSSAGSAYDWLTSGECFMTDVLTSDYFDFDGHVSVHAAMYPDAVLRQNDALVRVARRGYITCTDFSDAIRMAACLLVIAVDDFNAESVGQRLAERIRELLPLAHSVLAKLGQFESIRRIADSAIEEAERAFSTIALTFEEDKRADLAVFNLKDRHTATGSSPHAPSTDKRGDQVRFHIRMACRNILLMKGRCFEFWQGYEGWVDMPEKPPRRRPDLAALAASLILEEREERWSSDYAKDKVPKMPIEVILGSKMRYSAIRCRIAPFHKRSCRFGSLCVSLERSAK